jgi:putative ABC transport system permease protein
MILRQLERRPARALLSCLGIALAVGIMIVGAFVQDAVNYVMDHQFQTVQRQDLMVGFVEATERDVLADVRHLPGVTHVEGFRSLAVRIHSGPVSRRLGIMALEPEARLFSLLDQDAQPVALPEEGIVISDMLAKLLDVRPGEMVRIEVLESERPTADVLVSGTVREFTGTSAYMRLDAANRLMKRGGLVSGAFVTADRQRVGALYDELKRVPQVASVSVKAASLQSFRDTIAQNLMVMRTLNVTFACIIAFGVIYNSARIALSERSRELATMRVIGFTRGEISVILLGELATLVLIAIPLGLLIGHWLARLATYLFETEMFRVPFIIEPSTYAFAAIVALVAAALSGFAVRRRLDHLDLVGVLKTWE